MNFLQALNIRCGWKLPQCDATPRGHVIAKSSLQTLQQAAPVSYPMPQVLTDNLQGIDQHISVQVGSACRAGSETQGGWTTGALLG